MAKHNDLKQCADFAQELADASRVVLGEAIRRSFRGEIKSDGSPVTEIDRAVEERLRAMIEKTYPDHGIVGEEHGTSAPESDYVWVLDPIDGTLAFLAGIPVFGTLIALARDGVPVVGVIDLPATAERWDGAEGMASRYNGTPIEARSCAGLSSALMSNSNPDFYSDAERPAFERLKASARWTVYGGSCLAYAQIASGRIDVGVDAALDVFDYCALAPVIQGAGGVVTDWDGAGLTIHSGSRILAAGDPRAHAEALELLAGG